MTESDQNFLDTFREMFYFLAQHVEGFGDRIEQHYMYSVYIEAKEILEKEEKCKGLYENILDKYQRMVSDGIPKE